jgi:hypothetical protein
MSSPRSRAKGSELSWEPLQGVRAGEVLALNLGVELGHDPVELFERAAQTLAVLLREFGPLRADQSGQHGDGQGKSARQHRLTRPIVPGG